MGYSVSEHVYHMVWYKSARLAADFGTRREQENYFLKESCGQWCAWDAPSAAARTLLVLQPAVPQPSSEHCGLWQALLGLGGKEGADRSSQ